MPIGYEPMAGRTTESRTELNISNLSYGAGDQASSHSKSQAILSQIDRSNYGQSLGLKASGNYMQ